MQSLWTAVFVHTATVSRQRTVYNSCLMSLRVPRNSSPMYGILFLRCRFKTSNIYQGMYDLISAFVTQKFHCFRKQVSPSMLHPKSQTFYQYFKWLKSIVISHNVFSPQSRMSIRKNVNSDVIDDLSMPWNQQTRNSPRPNQVSPAVDFHLHFFFLGLGALLVFAIYRLGRPFVKNLTKSAGRPDLRPWLKLCKFV